MATLEKLVRAFEALKVVPSIADEAALRRKEQTIHCITIADAMCNASMKSSQEFLQLLSISIETLLQLCNDPDSNIRMVADESLNRIIRALMDNNVGKIQLELLKEIKKNGNARTLRAALWRFAELCHMIRPQKGRAYIQNLVPHLEQIAKRTEEPVLETLCTAVEKIFKSLGIFSTDNEVKILLRGFLQNMSSSSAVIRRTSAASIVSICVHCKKPETFITWCLNVVLDSLIPLKEDNTYFILGALGVLRTLIPHLKTKQKEGDMKGSFGKTKTNKLDTASASLDNLIQIYELCVRLCLHCDHNVANASLECLQQLLKTPSPALVSILLSPEGINRSYILATQEQNMTGNLKRRTLSEISVSQSIASEIDTSVLLDEPEQLTAKLEVVGECSLANIPLTSQDLAQSEEEVCDSPGLGPQTSYPPDEPPDEEEITPWQDDLDDSIPDVFDCDIGDFCDENIPFAYCTRLLAKTFLLSGKQGGLKKDKQVRVSVKALAMGCMAGVVSLWPEAILLTLDKEGRENQLVRDILLYCSHQDPQLRGCTSLLTGSLIKTVLLTNNNSFSSWGTLNDLSLQQALHPIYQGLSGDSSVSCHQTLTTLQSFLGLLLSSEDNDSAIPLLSRVLQLKNNSYWLVKVRLVELLGELPYINVTSIQDQVLHTVLVPLLADQDTRVRHATSLAVVKIVPRFFFPTDENDPVTCQAIMMTNKLITSQTTKQLAQIEGSLSRIVHLLSNALLTSTTKHLMYGCCEALAELCVQYPATLYPKSWSCVFIPKSDKKTPLKRVSSQYEVKDDCSPAGGLVATVITLMTSSPISLDLTCQQWLLQLAANLFSGLAISFLQGADISSEEPGTKQTCWNFIKDKKLMECAEQILKHSVRVLSMFGHVLDDTVPVAVNPKPVLPQSLPSIPSPIKRKNKTAGSPDKTPDRDEKGDDKKGNKSFGYFLNSPQCLRLYELIKSAHTNYKLTLDMQASEKFLALLTTTLNVLCEILEVATLAGKYAEEILGYLRTTASVAPVATLACVQQLLKSLFGTNLGAQWQHIEKKKTSPSTVKFVSFYDNCYQIPYQELTCGLGERKKHTDITPSQPFKSKDRAALASYIKLFEPMVIKALEQYTMTSDVKLQCTVLQLLSQLVKLRVNYCLLDSDKVFIKFVLKQFELIEAGQILLTEVLIPEIFQFLVHLSYEKNHSKAIIGIPEVIQLCDGLMASGQSPATHCIPALVPVVEDVFLMRGKLLSNVSELDTQREVLVAMLLRLVDYHQVLELLSVVIRQSYSENKDRWVRWSTKVVDTLLPLLAQRQVRLESREAQVALVSLLDSLSPQAIDPMLHVLFSEPPTNMDRIESERWLGGVLGVIVHLLVHSSEGDVLLRVSTLNLDLISSEDPLNVSRTTTPPQIVIARLMLRIIQVVAKTILSVTSDYLNQQLAHFLFYFIYMLESGSYCKVAAAAIELIRSDIQDNILLYIENINQSFLQLAPFCPILTFLWCYMLVLLGYNERQFWCQVLRTSNCSSRKSICCNLEIAKRGAVILFSDYVCDNLGDMELVSWFINNHIQDIVCLSKEDPVQEFIAAVHRNPTASCLLVEAVATKCQHMSPPSLIARLVQQCLEGVHPSQSGALLQLIVSRLLKVPQLALARIAHSVACSRAEMLLMSPPDQVKLQLDQTQLQNLIMQIENKHERLKSLLKKLSCQLYNSPTDDISFDSSQIKSIVLDKSWFLAQVKQKCCEVDPNMPRMLSHFELLDILDVMKSPNFNLGLLQDSIKYGLTLTRQLPCEISPLLDAAQNCLVSHIQHYLHLLPSPHRVFKANGRMMADQEEIFSDRLSALFCDVTFRKAIVNLARAVPEYFKSEVNIHEQHALFAQFGVLSLELSNWQVLESRIICPGNLEPVLSCAASILSAPHVAQELVERHEWLSSACNSIFCLVTFLQESLPSPCQAPILSEDSDVSIVFACSQISTLVTWLETTRLTAHSISNFLLQPIRTVIIGLARLAPLNSYATTPPQVWRHGWNVPLGGPSKTTVPPIPLDMLLETDVLEQFIFRLTLVGWTSRQQFEENWMALLGVLNSGRDEEVMSPEEAMQVNGIAVKGITALLVQSLLLPSPGNPIASKLIHQPRRLTSKFIDIDVSEKIEQIQSQLFGLLQDSNLTNDASWQFEDVFHRANLERVGLNARFGYSQVCLEYLLDVASDHPDATKPAPYTKREECLTTSGIDLNSCLHFLLDLYTQWTGVQARTPLRLVLEAVRSVLMISDIFTEQAQFQWMLSTFLDIAKNHPPEDEILHQFLALGACKAAAVLNQNDPDVVERVRKMTENSLKSGFLPSRLCGLHGLLYILQSSSQDETLQLAVDYIQRHMDLASGSSNHSERHLLALWALVFFLLEGDSEVLPAVLQLALALVSAGNLSPSLNSALVQGLERLVLSGHINVADQITKLALEQMKHSNPAKSLAALQLLLTCMYTGDWKCNGGDPLEDDPEVLLQSLEKTSALFDRIKKGYPHESELFCGVLPTLLSDFFTPSEMLTKVIGEFLSSQQPHPTLLAGVVAQLFQRVCDVDQLALLQDWLIISLPNFTQTCPVGMAVWCLTCFFVSASTNKWLRAMFPHIQSRIGRCQLQDRQLLCLAARDFYVHLSASQQQDFVTTFQAAAEPNSPFLDIISSLL